MSEPMSDEELEYIRSQTTPDWAPKGGTVLQAWCQALCEEIDRLRAENASLQAVQREDRSALARLRERVDELRGWVRDLTTALENKNAKLTALERERDALKEAVLEAIQRLDQTGRFGYQPDIGAALHHLRLAAEEKAP